MLLLGLPLWVEDLSEDVAAANTCPCSVKEPLMVNPQILTFGLEMK